MWEGGSTLCYSAMPLPATFCSSPPVRVQRAIKTDRVLLDQFLHWRGDCDIQDVTSEDVRRYLSYHGGRGLSPHTVRRHQAVLSALYTWLTSPDVALVDANPVRSVPKVRLPKLKPKALTQESISALLAATEQGRCKRRDKALVLFLLDTGARASEATGLRMADVDFKAGRAKVNGKGDKERFVYLGRRALSALWLYVKDERPEAARVNDDHLFLTGEGYLLDRHSLRRIVYRLADRAGVKASPHQFRHTSAIEHLRHAAMKNGGAGKCC